MKTKVVLMKGTRNWKVLELTLPEDCKLIVWDNKGLIRNDSFDYCKTTKRGRVYRERTANFSSTPTLFLPRLPLFKDAVINGYITGKSMQIKEEVWPNL